MSTFKWRRLVQYRRKLIKNSFALPAIIVSIVFIGGAIAVYLLERSSQPEFSSVWDGLWWAIVTITTTGYGDVVPRTGLGRAVAVMVIITGFGLVPTITATVATIFVTRRLKEERGLEQITLKGHTVICNWNPDAGQVIRSLVNRSTDALPGVVLINNLPEATMNEILSEHRDLGLRWVNGDFSSEAVLRLANIQAASVAIILSDTLKRQVVMGDEKTILATLTIKSLNPRVRVCAEVIDIGNELHLRRAGADEIIIHGEYDHFLLSAGAVNPGIPKVVRQLLSFEGEHLKQQDIPCEYYGKTFASLSTFFREKHRYILLGIVSEEKAIGLEDVLSADYSAVDAFIQKKFSSAGKSHLAARQTNYAVSLNPSDDYLIKNNDLAIIIGGQ